jgi:predicted lipoprotein with Yx(FWY)xxD motif
MRIRSVHTVNTTLAVSALITAAALTSACGTSGAGKSDKAQSTVTGSAAGSAGSANAAVPATAVSVKVQDSSLGPILTDQDGRTLYAFLNDKNGSSSCTGTCIATWPALISTAPAGAGAGTQAALLSQTTRAEGTSQATYNKWPLYYYVGDTSPGAVDGEGLDGVWFAVGADGKLVQPAAG